jgi:hypothetical protein
VKSSRRVCVATTVAQIDDAAAAAGGAGSKNFAASQLLFQKTVTK